MHSKKELDVLLRESGIQPLKKLGQNFLVNPRICEKIVDAVLGFSPSSVVEVGPGLGAITDGLVTSGVPLTLVELDSGLVKFWEGKGANVIHEDALKLNWDALPLSPLSILVSNLPYSIAASLVVEMSLLDVFDGMILMFQKEVAERIAADKDDEDYGMLSVVAQNFWRVEKLVDAGPQDFFPVPNVGSRVLKFTKLVGERPSRDKFVAFVKQAFSQRRKKMIKNLESLYPSSKTAPVVSAMGFDENLRAQELTPQQFLEFFKAL